MRKIYINNYIYRERHSHKKQIHGLKRDRETERQRDIDKELRETVIEKDIDRELRAT